MYDPDDIMQFFSYTHLPAHLQEVSKRFHEMAGFLMDLPACRERQKALDALLVAKDAAVRAKLVEQLSTHQALRCEACPVDAPFTGARAPV